MAVIFLCDRCNIKSENTYFDSYEGYSCGDIKTFSYTDTSGVLHSVDLCENYGDVCLAKFKEEHNIKWVNDRTTLLGAKGFLS